MSDPRDLASAGDATGTHIPSAPHTPGPWRVVRSNNLPTAIAAPHADLGSIPVAKMVIANDHEANARLIASAPAFYAIAADFIAPYAEVTEKQLLHACLEKQGGLTINIPREIAAAVLAFRGVIRLADGAGK